MTPIRRLIAKKVALAQTLKAKFEIHRGYSTRIHVSRGGWFEWDGVSGRSLAEAAQALKATPSARAVLWITHPKISHSDALPHEDVTTLVQEFA